ncbi:Sec39-domain-containing protein [Panus rudis PR-1116 ss-1]|nr:Sec39-domain-containing protein [Panus rudis PR-1116 ss-1]
MASTSTPSESPYVQWNNIADDELTVEQVEKYLTPIQDDLWVTAACVDRLVDDVSVQRAILELGIQRTEGALERSRGARDHPTLPEEDDGPSPGPSTLTEEQKRQASLSAYFRDHPSDAQLCQLRIVLLERLDRLNTFSEVLKELGTEEGEGDDIAVDEWDDDPWADETGEPVQTSKSTTAKEPPVPLFSFLVYPLLDLACLLATTEEFSALRILMEKHGPTIWPFRFIILDSIPEHSAAADYRELLPAVDLSVDREQHPTFSPWRSESDWTERQDVRKALANADVDTSLAVDSDIPSDDAPNPEPLPVEELLHWYRARIDHIVSSTGMVDVALSLVQHAASQGVPGLDEVGEDLSLLSRLIYDVPSADKGPQEDWTLERWKSLEPLAAICTYLAHSTPETIARDINRLVMPYLFVLEARAERAGHPDPSLATRLLYEYILGANLEIVAGIFEASKPTLPPAQRLIKDDEDIARLALACLYGSDSLDEWPTMSRIFECLPAWDITQDEDEADETETTIASLGDFVKPSTTRPRCTPADLLLFFKPLPTSSLSRALDILDEHLESGEILARWSVPAPLRWFLQSNSNIAEQRAWAQRMARRAGGSDDQLSSQEDWEWLLEDMLKLAGSGESGKRGAFCLLSKDDVTRIFFEGLVSTGKFDIAKNMLRSHKSNLDIDPTAVEDICLTCSQEFYDNASSGNYHFGDMKLAYDCLDVPPPSERVIKEKEFIEATSRLCSFNLMSRPGIPISPIEIRLTKDRLSLVSRVLSSNNDAYKHTQVILDLVHKLGFRGDIVAEVKTLAMLADTALQAEDFDRAYETCHKMVETVQELRKASLCTDDPTIQEASEVCWVACYQLGRQPEFQDVPKKLILLGRAMELCPAERLVDILTAWRRLEQEDMEERERRLEARRSGAKRDRAQISHHKGHKRSASTQSGITSLTERLQRIHMPDLHMPSSPLSPLVHGAPDAAALAGKAFNRVAANFPFGVGARGRSLLSNERDRSRSSEGSRTRYDGGEVSVQATKVLQKGLGWLLGDDEES